MKRQRRIFPEKFLILLCLCGTSGHAITWTIKAEDENGGTIKQDDGTELSLPADGISLQFNSETQPHPKFVADEASDVTPEQKAARRAFYSSVGLNYPGQEKDLLNAYLGVVAHLGDYCDPRSLEIETRVKNIDPSTLASYEPQKSTGTIRPITFKVTKCVPPKQIGEPKAYAGLLNYPPTKKHCDVHKELTWCDLSALIDGATGCARALSKYNFARDAEYAPRLADHSNP